ncbi:carbohydrate porin [Sphingomonas sp. RHCKR7]|uniref:carbohydrate porin n=1 Tax=Sphingomonas folli TaxID=2862497 RepID=UPI001C686E99|nr:carbohydrate porin [Sphingomonas folli]MBW6526658.1 carbohydrate porin [Sphingomonas folli]
MVGKGVMIAAAGVLGLGAPAVAQPAAADASPHAVRAHCRRVGPATARCRRAVTVSARYVSETAYNPVGGARSLVREASQLAAGATVDMERLAGVRGGIVKTTLTWRRGRSLGVAADLGLLQQVQEIYGRGNVVRLTQAWWEQKLGDGVAVKLGRSYPGEDFAVFSCDFMNLAFCAASPGALAGDYWHNWPIGQWGTRLRVAAGKGGYVAAGAYEINPRNLDTDFTLAHLHGATGVLVPVELGAVRGGDGERLATYKAGGWYATGDSDDVLLDGDRRARALTGAPPLRRHGHHGVYVSLQQQVSGTAADGKVVSGLSLFFKVTEIDRATARKSSQVALGAFYDAPLPGRLGDAIGVAVARTGVNQRLALDESRRTAMPPRDAEYSGELFYNAHFARWLDLRPNLQWIHRPGGVRSAGDIGVVGLKAAMAF